MKAFLTASFDAPSLERLKKLMDVHVEDWRATKRIFFDGAEFARRMKEEKCDVVIVEADLVHAEVIEGAAVKMIGACRGDPVNVDVKLASERGIPVFHTPARNADAVADLTLAFMLMLVRHLPAVWSTYHDGEATRVTQASDYLKMYTRFTGVELGGLTVGLVGLGAVGREVAARLAGFKTRILAYDPYVREPPAGVTLCDLDTVLRDADIISLHAPVTPETQGLLSAERLALMKPSALFVNTARAALTDENALYDMLRSGRLAGAALDVLAEEPLQPGNRFLALPNVVVTPHLGGATTDVTRHQSDIIVDAMERWLRGERPRWIANPAVLDGRS